MPHLMARLFKRLMAMAMVQRSRRRLAELDDHMLACIGITRADAQAEASRPVWDAPLQWFQDSRAPHPSAHICANAHRCGSEAS